MKKTVAALILTLIFLSCNPMHYYQGGSGGLSGPGTELVTLPNGFQAILIENHNAPVAASVVMVRTGSARENFSSSGTSHMLEHLLFNGTKRRTQQALYNEQDLYGIYNNAQTTREYTAYMVLSLADHFDRALDIQSDMLFNSTLPGNKFQKEKGIVLNEIAMERTTDAYWADEQFQRKYYAGTPYNLPVLGIPETIKRLTRGPVYKFYKRYYVPNNMTAIVMGDFDSADLKEKIVRYFGGETPGPLPEKTPFPGIPKGGGPMVVSRRDVGRVMVRIAATAPGVGDSDFFPYYLLIASEEVGFKERIDSLLRGKGEKSALSASIDIELRRDMSILTSGLDLPRGYDIKKAVSALREELESIPKRGFNRRRLKGIVASLKMEEYSLRERPHYFGLMSLPKLSAGGWGFVSGFVNGVEGVSMGQLERAAEKYFSSPSLWVSAVAPGGKGRKISEEEKAEYFKGSARRPPVYRESRLLKKEWDGSGRAGMSNIPRGQRVRNSGKRSVSKREEIKRVVLDNGLTVLIKKADKPGVFAAHLLFGNRSGSEPVGKEGIAELLHNILGKRTNKRDRDEVRSRLMDMGAKLKTADNPNIPFDNYYLSSDYSYVRFETMDEHFDEGLELLSDIIIHPRLNEADMEEEKRRMISLALEKEKSASSLSYRLLLSALMEKDRPFASIYGTAASVKSITIDDLKEFHKRYFSPKNIILSIVSGVETERISRETRLRFGRMSGPPASRVKDARVRLRRAKTIREKLGRSQSYVRVGKVVEVEPDDRVAVEILSVLLSERVSFQLREREGISYSTWAGFMEVGGKRLLIGAVGTTPDRIEAAVKGLKREISAFRGEKISEKDIKRALNGERLKGLMRRLTRIGQAYYLGLSEFLCEGAGAALMEVDERDQPTPAQVESAARKYLGVDGMVTVIVE